MQAGRASNGTAKYLTINFTDGTGMTRQPIVDLRAEGMMLVIDLYTVESAEQSAARSVNVKSTRTRIYPMSRILYVEVESTQVITK